MRAVTTRAVPPPPPLPDRRGERGGAWGRLSRRMWVQIGVAVALAGVAMIFAGRAWLHARGEAEALAGQLHARIDATDWEEIRGDADPAYRERTTSADDEALFGAIHRKLGQVKGTTQQTTNLTVTPSGSYLTAQFATEFEEDPHATETIAWRSLGGAYHLYSYRIESLPLLTR